MSINDLRKFLISNSTLYKSFPINNFLKLILLSIYLEINIEDINALGRKSNEPLCLKNASNLRWDFYMTI